VALISSLLLLIIIPSWRSAMFRSFGTQEKIAATCARKTRALQRRGECTAYGEWWLIQGNNAAIGAVTCAGTLNANLARGRSATDSRAGRYTVTQPGTWAAQISTAPTMAVPGVAGPNGDPPYFGAPAFYVTDLGLAATAPVRRTRLMPTAMAAPPARSQSSRALTKSHRRREPRWFVINRNSFITVLAALVALGVPLTVQAQAGISEDFTGASTTNSWYFFNGACLTAGTSAGLERSALPQAHAPVARAHEQLLQ